MGNENDVEMASLLGNRNGRRRTNDPKTLDAPDSPRNGTSQQPALSPLRRMLLLLSVLGIVLVIVLTVDMGELNEKAHGVLKRNDRGTPQNQKKDPTAKPAHSVKDDANISTSLQPNISPPTDQPTEESQQQQEKYKYVDIKQRQIQSYIHRTGLMLSIHVTHHGGTYLCHQMKKVGEVPGFACMAGDNWPVNNSIIGTKAWTGGSQPWSFNDTDVMIREHRKYFHMISWEYNTRWGGLVSTNWQHPDLLSVAIMRDPLERFMAGGKCGSFHHSIKQDLAEDPSLSDLYWEYANDKCADNFALRVFTGSPGCCNGAQTNITYLEQAKKQMDEFTILIDQSCETESIQALSDLLHLNLSVADAGKKSRVHTTHPPVRERIGNETLYEYLQEKFKLDIELYEYAKSKSILDCSTLQKTDDSRWLFGWI
jgi:hypothetical protein